MTDIENALWLCERDPRSGMRELATKFHALRAQDAAIADLQVADGYAQAAHERLTREIAALAQSVAALEEVNTVVLADLMARVAALEERTFAAEFRAVVKIDPATITWTGTPPPVYTPGYPQEETP